MSLNERISAVIDYSGLTSSEFADEIEVQRSSISHITSGRNKPSLDFIVKIRKRFPEISWDWLINAEGDMLIPQKEESQQLENQNKTTSLPDLFNLINDENFGITESEDRILKENPPKSRISEPNPVPTEISDSQQSANKQTAVPISGKNLKRVILFFENGSFESYEV